MRDTRETQQETCRVKIALLRPALRGRPAPGGEGGMFVCTSHRHSVPLVGRREPGRRGHLRDSGVKPPPPPPCITPPAAQPAGREEAGRGRAQPRPSLPPPEQTLPPLLATGTEGQPPGVCVQGLWTSPLVPADRQALLLPFGLEGPSLCCGGGGSGLAMRVVGAHSALQDRGWHP